MTRRRDATRPSDGPNGLVVDGSGDGIGDGIRDCIGDCIEDDHNLLSDHSHSDDHALLSFPEITSRSDEDPAQAKGQVEALPSVEAPPPPTAASAPTSSLPLGASGDRSRLATNQTHPDFVPPTALFPSNMTEGVSNRRLSWAERR